MIKFAQTYAGAYTGYYRNMWWNISLYWLTLKIIQSDPEVNTGWYRRLKQYFLHRDTKVYNCDAFIHADNEFYIV